MPLHLLGKKSWNVYNADNIARVRRDEALAQAKEEAEEQRMQHEDADRRMAILRGEQPPPPAPPADDDGDTRNQGRAAIRGERRKRKRQGEDDTEFEMRIARDRWDERYEDRDEDGVGPAPPPKRAKTSSAPIVDREGHIDLFGQSRSRDMAPKESREGEPIDNMKFADAGGKDDRARAGPWYAGGGREDRFETTNAFGNNDPDRKERAIKRIGDGDPLLMMKSGASKVRELNRSKKRAEEERARELDDLIRDERKASERAQREERRNERRERRRREERDRHRDGHKSRSRSRSRDGREDGDKRRRRHRDRRQSRSRSPRRESRGAPSHHQDRA